MRRSVDRLAKDRRVVICRATARAVALGGLVATGAVAGDGDGPELSPPTEMPAVSKPATPVPAPPPARATAPPPARAMLAIPGLTTPTARPSAPVDVPKPIPDPLPGELSLDAPIEMRPLPNGLPALSDESPARPGRPIVLESSPMDGNLPPVGSTSRPNPPTRRSPPPQPVPQPAKRSRLFGFLGGQATPSTPPSTSSKPSAPGRAVADPMRDDPSAESALKRRIERQAREVVGNRARSVEVKIDGKEVVVQVTGAKLFQKRVIRKQIEGLPALSGLRTTIQVDD